MGAKDSVDLLSYWQVLAVVLVGGGFGGIASSIFDNFDTIKGHEPIEHGCKKCNSAYFMRRALIGMAGSFCGVFLGIWLHKITLEANDTNLLSITCFCVAIGTVSFNLLPQLGKKIGEQILNDKINQADKKAEDALKTSYNAIDYSSSIAHAETALSRKQYNDIPQAVERLNKIKKDFPTDRTVHIYLGRLYRALGKYDESILILREFITNLERGNKHPHSHYIVDKADAYFNIACYHALKAKETFDKSGQTGEVERLVKESLESLSLSTTAWSKNKEFAGSDPDFDFIKDKPKFAEIINNAEIFSAPPEPA